MTPADDPCFPTPASDPRLREIRRDRGVYYTPPALARHVAHVIAELALGNAAPVAQHVFDPACGNGRLLSGMLRELVRRGRPGPASGDERAGVAPGALAAHRFHGIDLDRAALRRAHLRVTRLNAATGASLPAPRLHCADALRVQPPAGSIRLGDGEVDADLGWDTLFPEVFGRNRPGFDLIVSNPPFVNMRRSTRLYGSAVKRYLAERFRCARGAYDLYVLFLELAVELLRAGGWLAMIVPNKWLTADYASASRQLLAEHGSLVRIDDCSELAAFAGAAVYPLILYWTKGQQPSSSPHYVRITQWQQLSCSSDLDSDSFLSSNCTFMPTARRAPAVNTVALSELAQIASGATGFDARRLAQALEEVDQPLDTHYPFLVTGNIDRYVLCWGSARFMGQRWTRPALPRHHPCLSLAKQQLYGQPKLILAGLSRRLEAAWDPLGHALGVQTFAITAPEQYQPYLLGLLNSKYFTWLYRERYRGKQLGGRYIAVHKRPLSELPIVPLPDARPLGQHARVTDQQQVIATLAEQLTHRYARKTPTDAGLEALENLLDEAVYRLYGLDTAQASHVERAIAELEPGQK